MDKKAVVGLATVMFIIIALVSFGSMVGIALKVGESSEKISEGQACRIMLGMQDVSKKATFDMAEIDNNCEMIKIEETLGKGDELNLLYLLSDKIARSWWIVHEGKIDDIWNKDGFLSGESCKILYSINLRPKKPIVGQEQQISLTRDQFKNFFSNTIYPIKKKENLTYLQYLIKDNNVYFDILPQEIPLKTSKGSDKNEITNHNTYAIIIMSHDDGTFLNGFKYGSLSGITGGLITDYIVENYPDSSISEYAAKFYGQSFSGAQLYFTTMEMASNNLGCEYI